MLTLAERKPKTFRNLAFSKSIFLELQLFLTPFFLKLFKELAHLRALELFVQSSVVVGNSTEEGPAMLCIQIALISPLVRDSFELAVEVTLVG